MAQTNKQYRLLPSIETLLQNERMIEHTECPRAVCCEACRDAVAYFRNQLDQGVVFDHEEDLLALCLDYASHSIRHSMLPSLIPIVNATGIVLHTNIGRTPLGKPALNAIEQAGGYCNLELDLASGKRGSRYQHIEKLVCLLAGCEAAMVVNNNAAAILLVLDTLARGKQVLVSRSELIEIGGGFRLFDIMEKTGCLIKEVGSSNKTRLSDYEEAVTEETGLLLHVHKSNFIQKGFVEDVPLSQLVELAHNNHIPIVNDLGSGCIYPLRKLGIGQEPTISEVIATGVDLITFSGDKLLGGPQAGIIAGKTQYIDLIKKNPLLRALRIDKLSLAALEATLQCHLDPKRAEQEIPLLRMLLKDLPHIKDAAKKLQAQLKNIPGMKTHTEIQISEAKSKIGGGSLPEVELPTFVLQIQSDRYPAQTLLQLLLQTRPAILCYLHNNTLTLDLRTVEEKELKSIVAAFEAIFV